jgi:hypothetical protein
MDFPSFDRRIRPVCVGGGAVHSDGGLIAPGKCISIARRVISILEIRLGGSSRRRAVKARGLATYMNYGT